MVPRHARERRVVTAGMNSNKAARTTQIQEALVDRKSRELIADPALHVTVPRGVVEQVLEDGAAFDDVLIIRAVVALIRMNVNVADPISGLSRGLFVDPAVDGAQALGAEYRFEDQVALQVEEVVRSCSVMLCSL